MCNATEAKLFVFGCLCALVQIPLQMDAVGFGPAYELSTVAANLARTGEFRDPFGVATGPTAHVAPLYTFILAILIRLLGDTTAVIWAAILLNACLLALAAALLPRLSQRIYGGSAPGVAGGILLALSSRLMPEWEVALSALLLLIATLVILEDKAEVAGLCCGISMLCNPVSLPALVLLASSRGKRFAAITIVVAFALCTPWLARNWIVLGAPFFIRDNFGLELFFSNHDISQADVVNNDALWSLHPNQNQEEAHLVKTLGEGSYNMMRFRGALRWIRSHPVRFFRLSATRVFYYWLPPRIEGWTTYSYWVVTILAIAGAWWARRNAAAVLLAAAAVAYSSPFVIIHTINRHRFPSLWMSTLLAGYAVVTLSRRWIRQVHAQQGRITQ